MGKSKSNFTVNKSVLNFIHARDFFHEDDAHKYKHIVGELKYEPMDYGLEIPKFNMIWPDVDMLFGEMIGEYVKLDKEASGTFRRPWDCVHFEYYDNIYDWPRPRRVGQHRRAVFGCWCPCVRQRCCLRGQVLTGQRST